MAFKFDPAKLDRLNDPERLEDIPPSYIWDRLGLTDCNTVIDLGAGTGLFSRAFLALMKGGTVYAADTSTQMINWVSTHVVPDHPGIIPVLVEESRLPFDDRAADLVLLFNVYHELEDRVATLGEVYRVLRDGGKFCVVDWKKKVTEHGPPLDHRITSGEIAKELAGSGFIAVQTDETLRNHSLVWAEKP